MSISGNNVGWMIQRGYIGLAESVIPPALDASIVERTDKS
ncbi:hypothetical protein E3A20_11580 [Planctomyces bekefii]|uniref:Uncharacterized protein n=1 Tax=Planctomyces bekefii TaxID=1653850 RepID=A0A5C6M6C2_9PLAN|nr:hypothetical protein E3A20_11580 [Planctomyces bekefii]